MEWKVIVQLSSWCVARCGFENSVPLISVSLSPAVAHERLKWAGLVEESFSEAEEM